jgi:hypothetical protein
VGTAAPLRHAFETAVILSNVGAPVQVRAGGRSERLGRGETLLPGRARVRGAGRTG